MKKAQLRANLLDDSSPFVSAPQKNTPSYPKYPKSQKFQNNQNMPTYAPPPPPPPQQSYLPDNYNGSNNSNIKYRPQQPLQQQQHHHYSNHHSSSYPHQNTNPNPNPNPNLSSNFNDKYDYRQPQHHFHSSYPSNSTYQNQGDYNQNYGDQHQVSAPDDSYQYNYQYSSPPPPLSQQYQSQSQNDFNKQYQQQQNSMPNQLPKLRSQSQNYSQNSQQILSQSRSQSQSYFENEQPTIQREPLKPKKQVFSLNDESDESDEDNNNYDKSNLSSNSNSNAIVKTKSRNKSISSPKKSKTTSIDEAPVTSFNMSVNSQNTVELDKIQLLEEKIQRLERVLALQDLENKQNEPLSNQKYNSMTLESSTTNNPQTITSKPTITTTIPPPIPVAKPIIVPNTSQSSGAPPLPPPPPPEKKSLLNSPKANLFLSGIDTNGKAVADELRLSASSLIPTEKSLSDHSDGEIDQMYDFNDEEPPPSYEELENSGSLTYSQSIYRTGFEKAGYHMDHVITPTNSTRNPINNNNNNNNNNKNDYNSDTTTTKTPAIPTTTTINSLISNNNKNTSKITKELMSKRKIPSQITDDMFETAALKASLNSIPITTAATSTILSSNNITKSTTFDSSAQQSSQVPLPSAVEVPISKQPQFNQNEERQLTSSQLTFNSNKLENSQNVIRNKQSRSTMDSSLYTPKPESSAPIDLIKYSTDLSFESLPNGVIKPVLPSQSKEAPEETIARFRKIRENALSDYKQFTPKIQFYWAILLVETISKSEVLSKMTIDGKLRKNPISYKKLKKQRLMFLTTAIKVLEKLIQIAPNDTRARLYLGDIYSGGIHPGLIERNEELGYQLFYDAATKQNDPVACYRIACCLESGVGCKQDIEKSIIFFERGAALGDPSSMCQLGMMHFAGVNGCIQDISLSISYHKHAYETLRSKTVMGSDPLISSRSFQDARGALYTLAKLHQTDRQILCLTDNNDEKTQNTINELKLAKVWCKSSKALKYYLESAKLGHNESQACLGYYYSQGFFPTYSFKSDKEANNGKPDLLDSRKSIYWFSKAAADGHTYAALGLARWYGSGAVDNAGKVILKRDEQQAFLWGRKAADAGELSEAEFMIGICFEQGFGVEKNQIMAINYFERSARKGYKKAISKLKLIKNR